RFGQLNYGGETNRLVYLYRNRCWLPDGVGDHCYFHFENYPASYFPTLWIYNNSFAGGSHCLTWNSLAEAAGGTPNLYILNNILSVQNAFEWWPNTFAANASYV